MKSFHKRLLGTLTLGAFVVGIAGTSMAGTSAPAPAALTDYTVAAAAPIDAGDKVAVAPLAAAFLAGALVAEALHHHVHYPEVPIILAKEAVFDL